MSHLYGLMVMMVELRSASSSLSICLPIPQHGEHYRIELYESCSFSGQMVTLCDDCPFLQSRGLKSCINSAKVFGDGA